MDKDKLLVLVILGFLVAIVSVFLAFNEPMPSPPIRMPKAEVNEHASGAVPLDSGPRATLLVRIELLGEFPPAWFPRPVYGGSKIERDARLAILDPGGRPWHGAGILEFLEGPAAGARLSLESNLENQPLPSGWSIGRLKIPGFEPFDRIFKLRKNTILKFYLPVPGVAGLKGKVFGPGGKPVSGALAESGKRKTRTNDKGEFELMGLVPGDAIVEISAKGCASAYYVCPAAPGPGRKLLKFVLKKGASLEGRLVFPWEPAGGIRVFLFPDGIGDSQERFPFWSKGKTTAGPNGYFRLEGIPLGRSYRLGACGKGFTSRGKGARVEPLSEVRKPSFAFVSLERTGTIQGKVVDVLGKPIAGAWIRIHPDPRSFFQYSLFPGRTGFDLDRTVVPGKVMYPYTRTAYSSPDGSFTIEAAQPPGIPFCMECRKPGYLPQFLELSRPGRVVFRLLKKGKGEQAEKESNGPPMLVLKFKRKEKRTIKMYFKIKGKPLSRHVLWRAPDPCFVNLEKRGVYRVKLEFLEGKEKKQAERHVAVYGNKYFMVPF